MLSDAEKHEILAEAAACEQKRAAVPEALKIVQRHQRWVSDAAVADIAALLDMTPHEVDALATSYSLIFRRPVGRHVILLCDSVSCFVTGFDEIHEHVKATVGVEMGQTTADGRFTLLPAACLGACEIAPAMMVDDDLHGNLTPSGVDEILGRYL